MRTISEFFLDTHQGLPVTSWTMENLEAQTVTMVTSLNLCVSEKIYLGGTIVKATN